MEILLLAGLLSFAGVTIYVANQVEALRFSNDATLQVESQSRLLRYLLYGVLALTVIFSMAVFQAARLTELPPEMLPDVAAEDLPEINSTAALAVLALSIAAAYGGFRLINNPAFRLGLQRVVERLGGMFEAESAVHLTAVILLILLLGGTIAQFVFEGGISGVAENLRQTELNLGDTIFVAVLEVLLTFLGIGFAIRRGLPETLNRLGLRVPTPADIGWGLGVSILALLAVPLLLAAWQLVTPVEDFAAQTEAINALDSAVVSLPLAFVVAISAAVGEEIWLRGGFQPVFGIGLTSAIFAMLHIQALFSLGMFIFFAIGLVFGWLRQRYSTTAAVIAHFSFNFLPFLLASLVTVQ
jgi:hypothetical protein